MHLYRGAVATTQLPTAYSHRSAAEPEQMRILEHGSANFRKQNHLDLYGTISVNEFSADLC
jgi:hypothetical protein